MIFKLQSAFVGCEMPVGYSITSETVSESVAHAVEGPSVR